MRRGPVRAAALAGPSALALSPQAAHAHDAFGDLGPFYAGLLHPVMAPEQTLLLVAVAILMGRQPLASARMTYPAVVLAGVAGIVLHGLWPEQEVAMRLAACTGLGLGALALWGIALPRAVVAALASGAAALAAFAGDALGLGREGLLGGLGAVLGIAAFILLGWGAVDMAQARLGRIAGAVAAAWLIAICAMAVVLPA